MNPPDYKEFVSQLTAARFAFLAGITLEQLVERVLEHRPHPPIRLPSSEAAARRLAHVAGLDPHCELVAAMLLDGERDVAISRRVGKSTRTTKRLVGEVLERTGASNRAQLWAVLRADGRVATRPNKRTHG